MEYLPEFIFGAAVFTVGLYLYKRFVSGPFKNFRRVQRWQSVSATITKITVGGAVSLMNKYNQAQCAYTPEVEFYYKFGGKGYSSSNFSTKQMILKDAKAIEAIIKEYPVGMKVTAYANPSNPAEAVLKREAPDLSTGYFLSFVVLVLGILIIIESLINSPK